MGVVDIATAIRAIWREAGDDPGFHFVTRSDTNAAMAETTPVAIAVALDVSLAMALMDVLQTAVDGVNGLADALERSDRHLFAGCVAFSTGARVLDRAELSSLTWDFDYMTDLAAGIDVAADLLDDYPNRRLLLITALSFDTPFSEPSGFPETSREQLRGWVERAQAWRDDRARDELRRALDALAALVRRGAGRRRHGVSQRSCVPYSTSRSSWLTRYRVRRTRGTSDPPRRQLVCVAEGRNRAP